MKSYLGALALLGLCACAVQRPTVTPRKAALESLSLSALHMVVDLEVDNPNEFSLPLERMSWRLDLANSELADGAVKLDREISAKAQQRVEVPVRVTWQKAWNTAADVIRRRTIPFQVQGDLDFKTPLGALAVPYTVQGSWDNPLAGGTGQSSEVLVQVQVPRL